MYTVKQYTVFSLDYPSYERRSMIRKSVNFPQSVHQTDRHVMEPGRLLPRDCHYSACRLIVRRPGGITSSINGSHKCLAGMVICMSLAEVKSVIGIATLFQTQRQKELKEPSSIQGRPALSVS